MNFNPLLLDIPEQFSTRRLLVRAVSPGDGVLHLPALQESLHDLRQYLGDLSWVKEEPSPSNSEIYCRQNHGRFLQRTDLVYFMFDKNTQHLIGGIGLHRIDWSVPKFEIGYWCRVSSQGNGYVSEAVTAITALAFDQLAAKRVEIRADDDNIASWRVAEKNSFVLEGILRNNYRNSVTEKLANLRVYAKISI